MDKDLEWLLSKVYRMDDDDAWLGYHEVTKDERSGLYDIDSLKYALSIMQNKKKPIVVKGLPVKILNGYIVHANMLKSNIGVITHVDKDSKQITVCAKDVRNRNRIIHLFLDDDVKILYGGI